MSKENNMNNEVNSNLTLADKVFDKNNAPDIPAEMFERVPLDLSSVEKFEREGLTFWQDTWSRLKKNKGAIVAMSGILLIILLAAVGPYFNPHKFDEQIKPARLHAKLPPRVPGLEKLGIFDGTRSTKIGQRRYDKLVKKQEEIRAKKNDPEYQIFKLKKTFEFEGASGPEKRYDVVEYVYAKNGIENEYFWFGTDDLARDIWTRLWRGTRISIYVGLLAAAMDLLVGIAYGGISGFYGGKVDIIMMRIIEVIGGVPQLVILIIFIVALGPGLLTLSFALAMTSWMGMARIVRAHFLKLRGQEFVLAARTLGTPNRKLIFNHLVPNVLGQVIIMLTFTIPGAITSEAFLSFIGLGVPAPNTSLGGIISDSRAFMQFYPSMVFIPSTVFSIIVLAINIFANGLRDALDPRLKNS